MALVISTWLWGDKYGAEDVAKLASGFRRHMKSLYEFRLFRPEPEDAHLVNMKGCFARLRMFDPKWQKRMGLREGDKLVCSDLDSVITGPCDDLFYRDEPFVILHGANAANPCKFNGSLMMLRAGVHPEVWSDFSLRNARRAPFHEFPDDQGFIWHKIPNAAGWNVGPESGIYAFEKPAWPKSGGLPVDARMVVFPGWRSPQQFKHLPWVNKHWTVDREIAA